LIKDDLMTLETKDVVSPFTDDGGCEILMRSAGDVLALLSRVLDVLEDWGGVPTAERCLLYASHAASRMLATQTSGARLLTLLDQSLRAGGDTSAWSICDKTNGVTFYIHPIRDEHPDFDHLVLFICRPATETFGHRQEVQTSFGLTPREARVAELLAARKSNAEISCELGISQHTARHHTERVLAKLGISSRRRVASVLRAGEHT
jgi:DNA-binding CsgD family transcriptional regulator